MSYLGTIGHLMAGSGLRELFEVIYTPDAVVHMFSGKAFARAVSGHLFVDSVLNVLQFFSILLSRNRRNRPSHNSHVVLQAFQGEDDIPHHNRPSTFPASNPSSSELPQCATGLAQFAICSLRRGDGSYLRDLPHAPELLLRMILQQTN
ncbi:hypothetical protein PoB_002794800 [Plakobranchus ocellatus]|uniref:Uncharacterized protein n=1 Tax=Plakobranchus ocellatus TaxID=259542 RepID=A0AAV4A438_9GAST|nr:hypothetical protein PoB_002794800 [Plakobranchus ocellatus]